MSNVKTIKTVIQNEQMQPCSIESHNQAMSILKKVKKVQTKIRETLGEAGIELTDLLVHDINEFIVLRNHRSMILAQEMSQSKELYNKLVKNTMTAFKKI